MKTTQNDEAGDDRTNIIKLNPLTGPKCTPEVEQRIREAIAFVLGEIFDVKEEIEAKFDARDAVEMLLETKLNACEERLRLFEGRIAALEAAWDGPPRPREAAQ